MDKSEKEASSSWAVGGGVLLGLGVGFFLLQFSPLYFVGSILVGLGLGLVIAPIISNKNKSK
jgi:hypothetical protein